MAFDFITDAAKNVVAAAKQRPVLFKATSDDDAPTPGYIYEEISKLTWEDGDKSTDVLTFLLKRLDKDSPAVKLKCLRVLKYCVAKGHESFHRDLQRNVQPIKNATQFRGQPDPLRGDAPARQVREAATELLQIVYENPASIRRERPKTLAESMSNAPVQAAPVQAASVYRSPSAGPAPAGPSSTVQYNDDGSRKMWGHGNPEYHYHAGSQPNLLDRLGDKLSSAASAAASSLSSASFIPGGAVRPMTELNGSGSWASAPHVQHPVAQAQPSYAQTASSAAAQAATSSYNQARYGQTSLSSSEEFAQRRPGEVGGGWGSAAAPPLASSNSFTRATGRAQPAAVADEEEEDDDDEEEEDDDDAEHALSNGAAPHLQQLQQPLAPAAIDPNSLEFRTVNDITRLGVRAHPTREALAEFCQRCRSMNAVFVAAALVQCLEGEESAPQLRALYVVEAIATENIAKVVQELKRHASVLARLRTSPKNSVASKAVKVCLLLDIEDVPHEDAPQPQQPQQYQDTLLSLGSPQQPQAAAAPAAFSIWDEPALPSPVRQTTTPTSAPVGSTGGSLLDFANTSPAPASAPLQQQQHDDSDALFSGMSLRTDLLASTSSSSFNFIGSPTAAQPPVVAGGASADLLDVNLSATALMQRPGANLAAYMPPPLPGTGGGVTINPAMIERTTYTPNYMVTATAPTSVGSASSSSGFGFMGAKRDAFDFVQDEIRSSAAAKRP